MDISQLIAKAGITPNEMQTATIDAVQNGNDDVVVLSPTGTGKTLAYLLPVVAQIDAPSTTLQALVIVPGRELALQSDTVLKNIGSGLRSMAVYGGRPTMDEHRLLRQQCPQIIFGTPGRINDHIAKGNIDVQQLAFLVIDEFDKCMDMGFQQEIETLLHSIPLKARRILLSATQPEKMEATMNSYRTGHKIMTLDFRPEDEATAERIKVLTVHSEEKDKLPALAQLLGQIGQESSVVFLNYRDAVERVTNYLLDQGFSAISYQGALEQKEREEHLYLFANHSVNTLVSTNLGSRGIDIPDINNIIHYHLPESEQDYIHRIGRTARWDKTGRTFFLLGPEEALPEYVDADVEDYNLSDHADEAPTLPPMVTIYIGKGKKDKISKGDIVGFLCKCGGLQAKDIGRIDVYDNYAFVAVARLVAPKMLKKVKGQKIKGQKTIIEVHRSLDK